jgi:hypothetical protein
MYQYIGPEEILKQVNPEGIGKLIQAENDIRDWITATNQIPDVNDEITATFVIDLNENLRINDRRSEHVVCANGKNVLSAGEITFEIDKNKIRISQITNQSTGYCPSPKSWNNVENALRKTKVEFPDFWTTEFIFRICSKCNNINVIKDNFFVCMVCETHLPEND